MQDEIMNMLEADEIAEEAATAEETEVTLENGRNQAGSKQQRLLEADPCMDKHCGAGRVCKVRRRECSLLSCVKDNRFILPHIIHMFRVS